MGAINIFEAGMLEGLNTALRCDFLDRFLALITHLADSGIFWIILAVVLLIFRKTRKIGITMAIALTLGLIFCNGIIKPLVDRIRPYDLSSALAAIRESISGEGLFALKVESDASFPSGHTVASFEGAVALFAYNKKWGIAAIVLAVIIAFSRLYLCFHYPSDVIFGMIMGIGFAIAAYFLVKFLLKKTKLSKIC